MQIGIVNGLPKVSAEGTDHLSVMADHSMHHVETLDGNIPFHAIGDLDGRYTNFWRLSIQYGVMDTNGNWAGGSRTAVFLGDILADRAPEGFLILRKIHELSRQAEAQGGEIVVLAGNHEEFMLGYLTGQFVNLHHLGRALSFHRQRIACLDELKQFGDLNNPIQILRNMRLDPDGLIYLSYLDKLRLCHRIGKTGFSHTPPTYPMLKSLEKSGDLNAGVAAVNTQWTKYLHELLFFSDPSSEAITGYQTFAQDFLSTGNDVFDGLLELINPPSTDLETLNALRLKYQRNIAADEPGDYLFLQRHRVTEWVYGHTSHVMSHIPGMTFHTINADGMRNP